MRVEVPTHIIRIVGKLRAGQPLRFRDRLRLHHWQRREHRRYEASLKEQDADQMAHPLAWGFRVLFAYAVAGLILWLVTPLLGLGFALLVAMLAWIVMGAYWLS